LVSIAVGPAELKTLSRLLDEALALPPSERSRWLAALSGSDAIHRNTLGQLLAEADRPDDRFLARLGFRHSLTHADVLRIRSLLLLLWDAKDPTAARAMLERARESARSACGS
jgi:hypothetical protein